MSKTQGEKLYEYERASEALARKGRTGGLAYEVSRLLERLDKPSTAEMGTTDVLKRWRDRNTDTRHPLTAAEFNDAYKRWRDSDTRHPLTAAERAIETMRPFVRAQKDLYAEELCPRPAPVRAFRPIRDAIKPAPKFRVGDKVRPVATGGSTSRLLGEVISLGKPAGVYVRWPAIRTNLAYRDDELELVERAPRPFLSGDLVWVDDLTRVNHGRRGTVMMVGRYVAVVRFPGKPSHSNESLTALRHAE